MRTHGEYALLDLWADALRAERLVRTETLLAIRFELIERDGAALGWVDLSFGAEREIYVVPGVLIEPNALPTGSPGALVWPRSAAFAAARIPPLAERVVRHLEAMVRGRTLPSERAIVLGDPATFAAARARGELGAAPLGSALVRMAPWVYAARALAGRDARLGGRDAALGAAVLASFGLRVECAAPDAELQWYDVRSKALAEPALIAGVQDTDRAELRLALDEPTGTEWRAVPIAAPRPMDVAVAFDASEERAGLFWVRSRARPREAPRARRNPQIVAGPIAFAVRPDLHANPDVDTELVAALRGALQGGGAAVDVLPYGDEAAPAAHVAALFGSLADGRYVAALARAVERERPFLVFPEPIGIAQRWHDDVYDLLRPWSDDGELEPQLVGLDGRMCGEPCSQAAPDEPEAELLAASLGRAAAVVVGPDGGSPSLLRRLAASERLRIVTALPIDPAVGAAATIELPERGFVFAHGPAEPRSGLLTLVHALRDTDLPLILATSGAADFVTVLRRAAGRRTSVLVDAPAATLDALYRDAALFVDLALRPRGSARVIRALGAGSLPVVVAGSPFAAFLQPTDLIPRPTLESVRDTLYRLWRSPLRSARTTALRRGADAMLRGADGLDGLCQLFATLAPGVVPP